MFSGCVIKPFGSVVSGLALKSSDVDCLIDTHSDEDPIQCIKKSVHFLSNNSTPFQVVSRKLETKVPCMRILHLRMKIYCDITFSGPIAVEVGALFEYLLDIDKSCSLAVLVKYWSKVNKIAGTKLLPNSALTILLIVFLQKEHILPSIARLQENVPPVMIGGWNTAFERINWEPRTFKSLYQLLGEFFEFYSDFNFADSVVSPYLGGFVKRQCFSNINMVPAEFKVYKARRVTCASGTVGVMRCGICVQCPFEHSRNIAIAVKPPLANRIIQCFHSAAESYRNYPKHVFLRRILNVYEPQGTKLFHVFGKPGDYRWQRKEFENSKNRNSKILKNTIRKIRRGGHISY